MVDWTRDVIGKVGTPLKTFIENNVTAITAAFAKTINTDGDENNVLAGSLAYTASTLTLATGAVTGTRAHHVIAAESGTSDDFDTLTITNYSPGEIVYLRAATGHTIHVSTAGNFAHPCLLSATVPTAFLLLDGPSWVIVNKSRVLLDIQTASNSTSIDLLKGFGTAYDRYEIVISALKPVTDGANFRSRFSIDGSSFVSGSNSYEFAQGFHRASDGTMGGNSFSLSATEIQITNAVGSGSNEGVSGTLAINYRSGPFPVMVWNDLVSYDNTATPNLYRSMGHAKYNPSNDDLLGVQIISSAGANDIATGTVKVFGILDA